MNVDTMWFFEIFLAGFMTVWSFRYFSGNKEKYAEFEWFSLSAFWGLIIVGFIGMLPDSEETKNLLKNPLATGLSFSLLGMIGGYMGSRIIRVKWFKSLLNFLGRGGDEDKSEKLFK